jgi:hypothetical protein
MSAIVTDVVCHVIMDVRYVLRRVAMDVSANTHTCVLDDCGDVRLDITADIPRKRFYGDEGPSLADIIADTSPTTCGCMPGCPSTRMERAITDDP